MNDERSPRVLVVDDEARVRSLLCDMLAAWGCEAVEAASGETALALLEQGEYDLMLTDFLMPGRSGIDLIRDVRSRDAAISVIMITASAVDFDADSRRLEFTLLHKPLQLEELKGAVGQALRGRALPTPAAFS